MSDFANDMLDRARYALSDLGDKPTEWNGKLGDGVARGAEYASKWGMSGPASGVVKMVDKISGNNPVVDGRSDLSIFDHPVMSKANY